MYDRLCCHYLTELEVSYVKIIFLGTCSGTEPMPTRKHTSFCIESNHKIYWFDAGEGCSYTAHNLGVDLLAVHKVVISHTHMDHVGGLGNLFWNIRKISNRKKEMPYFGDIDLYIPNLETWEGVWKILKNTEGGFSIPFAISAHLVEDGVLFDDGNVKVRAYHNHHLPKNDSAGWLSYSYRIEAEGKNIVYSGDVGTYSDLDDVIGNGCDILILETGHFKIDTAYQYFTDKNIGKLYFSHHGREILNDVVGAQKKILEQFDGRAVICEDGMMVEMI